MLPVFLFLCRQRDIARGYAQLAALQAELGTAQSNATALSATVTDLEEIVSAQGATISQQRDEVVGLRITMVEQQAAWVQQQAGVASSMATLHAQVADQQRQLAAHTTRWTRVQAWRLRLDLALDLALLLLAARLAQSSALRAVLRLLSLPMAQYPAVRRRLVLALQCGVAVVAFQQARHTACAAGLHAGLGSVEKYGELVMEYWQGQSTWPLIGQWLFAAVHSWWPALLRSAAGGAAPPAAPPASPSGRSAAVLATSALASPVTAHPPLSKPPVMRTQSRGAFVLSTTTGSASPSGSTGS